ncbi:unnamed protein product, partial [Gulo gulo]
GAGSLASRQNRCVKAQPGALGPTLCYQSLRRVRPTPSPERGACKPGALRPGKTRHSQPGPVGKPQCAIAAWNISGG